MLPLQSLEAPAPHPPPSLPGPIVTADASENRNQKPKTLPCKYCSKRFRFVLQPTEYQTTTRKRDIDILEQTCRTCSETREDAHKGEALFLWLGSLR